MTAIKECKKLGIPIVSILDTNCDPDLVDIPIPGNDDAVRSIKLILKSLTDSIIKGKRIINYFLEFLEIDAQTVKKLRVTGALKKR
jgi:ribosomal protein S2